MRNGSCKYWSSCSINHPDPTAVGGNDSHPPPTYGNEAHVPLQNTSQPNMRNMTNMSSWSAPRTPDPTAAFVPAAAFVPMMYPPTQSIPLPNQDWNGYQAPIPAGVHVYPSSERGLPIPPAFFLNNPPNDTNMYTHHHQPQMLVSDYPERPGQLECSYFMKTGDCKYKSGCKFHHPKSRITSTAPSVLSDKGLPLRPSSIRDRLNGGTLENSGRRRQLTGKRQRQDDDKWEHDLYEKPDPQVSNRKVGALDLRLKLQKKSNQLSTGGGVRDLREKLSGITYTQPPATASTKPKPVPESSKPARRSAVAETGTGNTKKVASVVSKKKKVETVDTFLQALGLEKYSITFQAEEVDMTALLHMTDEDLKAIGIPMGPRKKILLALESKA